MEAGWPHLFVPLSLCTATIPREHRSRPSSAPAMVQRMMGDSESAPDLLLLCGQGQGWPGREAMSSGVLSQALE